MRVSDDPTVFSPTRGALIGLPRVKKTGRLPFASLSHVGLTRSHRLRQDGPAPQSIYAIT